MKLSTYLTAERGRIARVAKAAGLAPAFVSQMANSVRPIPPVHVPALEQACDLVVRRWDMRPHDWHRIWPELVGTEGAPAPESLGDGETAGAAVAGSADVVEPDLDAQLGGTAPLVNDHRDAPCAAAAEIDHFALSGQGGGGGQESRSAAPLGQVPSLILGDTQMHLDGDAVALRDLRSVEVGVGHTSPSSNQAADLIAHSTEAA